MVKITNFVQKIIKKIGVPATMPSIFAQFRFWKPLKLRWSGETLHLGQFLKYFIKYTENCGITTIKSA
jgi:hypothetical protein